MIFLIFLLALSAAINFYFANRSLDPVIKYVEFSPGWIRERFPGDNEGRIIVYFHDQFGRECVQASSQEYDRYGNLVCWGNKVKCWMPMPKPPKGRPEL